MRTPGGDVVPAWKAAPVAVPNLTRDDAAARAALLTVTSYDLSLDVTDGHGRAGEDTFRSVTTVRFTAATPGADGDAADGETPHRRRLRRFAARASQLEGQGDTKLKLLGETLLISYVGTLTGAVLAFMLNFFAAENTSPAAWLRFTGRRLLEFARTVPGIVFALIFVMAFGLGPVAGVLAIAPYVPGKSAAPGAARVFKLSSNETPLGPSPKAKAAYLEVAEHLQDYPDGAATPLREAISRAFGLDPDRILCGAGSDDLQDFVTADLRWRAGLHEQDSPSAICNCKRW